MSVPLFSRMSVTSKNEIRYEGVLVAVDAETSTLTLAQVQAMGTEGRAPGREVPPLPNVFPSILFRGMDIKELKILAPPTESSTSSPSPMAASPPQQPSVASAKPVAQTGESSPPAPAYSFAGPLKQPQQSRMAHFFESTESPNGIPSDGNEEKSSAKPVTQNQRQTTSTSSKKPAVSQPEKKNITPQQDELEQSQPSVPFSATTNGATKKSVFDDAKASTNVVVTVSGIRQGSSLADVRNLFGEMSVSITQVRLLSLPSGESAADVVFFGEDAADKAIEQFDQPGLTVTKLPENRGRRGPPGEPRVTRTRGGAAPQLFAQSDRPWRTGASDSVPRVSHVSTAGSTGFGQSNNNNEQRESSTWRRGGVQSGATSRERRPWSEDNASRHRDALQHNGTRAPMERRTQPESIGKDFDFVASNAKFDKERDEQAAASTKSKSGGSSFFDDATISQNFQSSSSTKHFEDRRKNAETFGAIAYTYRGGSATRGRGSGRGGRGGGYRGRGGPAGRTQQGEASGSQDLGGTPVA